MRVVLALAVGLLIAAGSGAAAQSEAPPRSSGTDRPNQRIDRFTVVQIGEILDTLELGFSVGEGPYGQPVISVRGPGPDRPVPRIDGFEVRFLGCDSDGRCDEMSLVSRYRPSRPTSLTTVNRFNQGTRFTTAYTGPEGELVLSMDLSAVGGIGRQATMVMIAIYVFNMESFAEAIGQS